MSRTSTSSTKATQLGLPTLVPEVSRLINTAMAQGLDYRLLELNVQTNQLQDLQSGEVMSNVSPTKPNLKRKSIVVDQAGRLIRTFFG